MKKALSIILSAAIGFTLVGCQTPQSNDSSQTSDSQVEAQQMESVTGTIAYRERIALPDNAVVTVTLQDISLADAPAIVLAKQSFETEGAQVPFDFELSYDRNEIVDNHRYSVSARIEVNGKLRFITDTVNPVITDSNKTGHVDLRLVGVR